METPKIIYYPTAETPLAPDEIAATIGAALDGNPKLEQAFRQLLAQRLAFASVECAEVNLGERPAGHAGGRVAEVLHLQHELAQATKAARELRGRETGSTRPPLARPARGTARA